MPSGPSGGTDASQTSNYNANDAALAFDPSHYSQLDSTSQADLDTASKLVQTADAAIADAQMAYDQAVQDWNKAANVAQNPPNDANGKPIYPDNNVTKAAADRLTLAIQNRAKAQDNKVTALASLQRAQEAAAARLAAANKPPEEKAYWLSQAQANNARAQLDQQQANMYRATTQAQIQQAQANATNLLATAQRSNLLAPAEAKLYEQQANLAASQANETNTLVASKDKLLQAQAANQQSGANLNNAQADVGVPAQANANNSTAKLNNAQADTEVPARAKNLDSQSNLNDAQAAVARAMLDPNVRKVLAETGLTDAQMQAVMQSLTTPAIVDKNTIDNNNPMVTVRDPKTGALTAVPNPSYQAPGAAALNQYYGAIDAIKQQIANGAMTPDEADQYIGAAKQALDAQMAGVTPTDYMKERDQLAQNQATAGATQIQNRISAITSSGQSLVNNALSAAKDVRGLGSGFSFTPFSNMTNLVTALGGGEQAYNQAQDAVSRYMNMGPIQSRGDAMQALQTLVQAKQQLTGGQNASQAAPQAPQPMPAPASPGTGAALPQTGSSPSQVSNVSGGSPANALVNGAMNVSNPNRYPVAA